MKKTWRLNQTTQCATCPWIVGVNPREIPNGYDEDKHRALISTIADPGTICFLDSESRVMACHKTASSHCIGWLNNQLGPGNSIALRLHMLSCENTSAIKLRGEQHERFEDTLPLPLPAETP